MTIDGEQHPGAAGSWFKIFAVVAVLGWTAFAFCLMIMAPSANEQEGLADLSGFLMGIATLPVALICTGIAAIARAADRGGIGWVVLGAVSFLAVCASKWLFFAAVAVIQ
jgi:hypothetical protein